MAALLWLVDRGTVTVRLGIIRPNGGPQPSLGAIASFKSPEIAITVTAADPAAALAALRLAVEAQIPD